MGGLHEQKTQFQSSYRKSQHAASTHTLLWGVTRRDRLAASSAAVSTHTPLWGVTVRICNIAASTRNNMRFSRLRTAKPTRFPTQKIINLRESHSESAIASSSSIERRKRSAPTRPTIIIEPHKHARSLRRANTTRASGHRRRMLDALPLPQRLRPRTIPPCFSSPTYVPTGLSTSRRSLTGRSSSSSWNPTRGSSTARRSRI